MIKTNIEVSGFDVYRNKIETSFINNVKYQFDRMSKDLGDNLKNVHNDWDYAKIFHTAVQPYTKVQKFSNKFYDCKYSIDEEKLVKGAKDYAQQVITECEIKLNSKLGELEETTCNYLDASGSFVIKGKKNGCNVIIEQHMILNVSKFGLLFNQFPARISIDGKSISELKYKTYFDTKL